MRNTRIQDGGIGPGQHPRATFRAAHAELRLIGTSSDEWLDGEQAFSVFRHEAATASGTLRAEVSNVEAYSDGGVGWGAALVRFTIPSGQTARSRFSVVFILHDGTWKVASAHNSIAVIDEDAFTGD